MEYTQDQIDQIRDKSWDAGNKAALLSVLGRIVGELGPYEERSRESLILEREQAILYIRNFVREDLKEDDDFEDNLHLSDIIDNYIVKNIDFDEEK